MLLVHIGIASSTTYVTDNKEDNYLEIYTFQVLYPLSTSQTANQY